MNLIYNVISYIFLLISPVIIIYRFLINKEDKKRFFERFAINSQNRKKGKLIWFHCSSVGELLSIVPIIEKLEKENKIKQILLTSTTLSSSKIFSKLNLKKTIHQFFPIDNPLIINKFLSYWKPSSFFLCESEIWPNLLNNIKLRNIKLILINGRMTKRSFDRWKKIYNFAKNIFNKFDICFVQNSETKTRLAKLGAKNIKYLGNLKFSTSKGNKNIFLDNKNKNFLKKKKILVTAASTHFNEEDFIIQNHLYFKKKRKNQNYVSIIVPRHIERINQIKNEIEKHSLTAHLYSSNETININTDFFLVDTYGELNKFYKISYLVFMGGSLINHGGQNPLEAAKFGCKIIHGPHISNFKEIYKKLENLGISNKFSDYKNGFRIIEKAIIKKQKSYDNKKLINYGEKILNLTYSTIIKNI